MRLGISALQALIPEYREATPLGISYLPTMTITNFMEKILQSTVTAVMTGMPSVCNMDELFDQFSFFVCYSTGLVTELVLRHNDNPIPKATVNRCETFRHTLTVNSTHEGSYECVTQLRNGTFRRYTAGYLHAIGEGII